MTRTLALVSAWSACALAVTACGGDDGGGDGITPPQPQTFNFGPFGLAAGQESAASCVSASLGNDEPMYVNAVTLDTGGGFHHSNWFWVPEDTFPGADGIWDCESRLYDEVTAGAAGGVLFAQSTQAVGETQQFPEGVVIPIPPHAKIVAGVHLLNASDEQLTTSLDIELAPIAAEDVQVKLVAMALTYEPLALPPHRKSSFTVECDLGELHQRLMGRPLDFNLYYALPHYHGLGRGIDLVADSGTAAESTVFTTTSSIGEPLGKAFSPSVSLTGHQNVSFTCHFDNPRDTVVRWGIGDQEMCVIQVFTDSTYKWAGGARDNNPGTMTDDGDVVSFTHDGCELYGFPAPEL